MTAKILVIDDEPLLEYVILQLFRHQISTQEFEFDFATNGVQALDKLQANGSFDLVLTDISMPEMDGLTLLENLPAIDPTLKAVVVSAYGDMPNIRTAMNRGAFDFLTKPIDFDDLKITINKTLEFVRLAREKERQLTTANEQIRYQAFYDELTGLPNRNLLLKEMRSGINTIVESGHLEAILFLALNRYQIVKYGLGHSRGEQLLVEVARRLEACVLNANLIARVGENTFAIWLANITNSQLALDAAERIRQSLERPSNLNGTAVFSSISIGIALSAIDTEDAEDLLRAADAATHEAFVRGAGSAVVFNVDMQSRALKQLQLETDLQNAINLQQFYLNYQPIVSFATGRIVGFEALVRWRHPSRGLVPPSEFIPVAERTGLIVALGEWILSEAVACLSKWKLEFPNYLPLNMSVNLSGLQLFAPNLLPLLDSLLRVHNLKGEFLKLEITESVLMENAEAAADVLELLKTRQFRVCLDDFGTGYSNLSYLQLLPIDTLKIDRSFVNCMEEGGKKLALVGAILNLASSLELEVIAEGVETEEQLIMLRALGCHSYQGYFFSRPLEEEGAVALLRATSLLSDT
ncbi:MULTISPECIES: putative bifunctional diguanylate cyclase/phosphodiesterase [Kamptonema]|uniref:putative bifunctional diguanylate cyclase/phosphodiesterase n=1 Tax=Kamptonema TaxID=1501433 RepID=UPI0001DAC62C|nr:MULTISPECIES: EAL domain-containing response regulator [Kamptonema]CBN53759.1 putative Response regulator receiver modulated diguanylate cyclase/phosphodiesterase [Kamptonema sp. PCC 6506]